MRKDIVPSSFFIVAADCRHLGLDCFKTVRFRSLNQRCGRVPPADGGEVSLLRRRNGPKNSLDRNIRVVEDRFQPLPMLPEISPQVAHPLYAGADRSYIPALWS